MGWSALTELVMLELKFFDSSHSSAGKEVCTLIMFATAPWSGVRAAMRPFFIFIYLGLIYI